MPVKAKTIKDLPLKNEFDGSESLLVQDSNGTQQAPLEVIIDEIKQNSQEKIREIESELDQTNTQLSTLCQIVSKKTNVSSDWDYLQDALNKKGNIFIADSKTPYIIDKTLTIYSDTTLKFGDNAIIQTSDSCGKAIVSEKGGSNINIINPKLIGNGNVGTEWDCGIHLVATKDSNITGGIISDFRGDGITVGQSTLGLIETCENITISDIVVKNCYRQGISLTDAKNCVVKNNNISNISDHYSGCGIAIDLEPNGEFNVITKNIINSNVITDCVGGIYLSSRYNVIEENSLGNLINDNIIKNIKDYGIKSGYKITTIQGNVIQEVQKHGIYITLSTQTHSNTITSNTIIDAGYGLDNTYSCIYLETCVNSLISNNTFVSTKEAKVKYCFSEDSSSRENSYQANNCRQVGKIFSINPTSKQSHNHFSQSVISNRHESFVAQGDIDLNGNALIISQNISIKQYTSRPATSVGKNGDIAILISPTVGDHFIYRKYNNDWVGIGDPIA